MGRNAKQEELKKQGMENKEIANVAVDRQRNKDLAELKRAGGLFTSAEEVDKYLQLKDTNDVQKQ